MGTYCNFQALVAIFLLFALHDVLTLDVEAPPHPPSQAQRRHISDAFLDYVYPDRAGKRNKENEEDHEEEDVLDVEDVEDTEDGYEDNDINTPPPTTPPAIITTIQSPPPAPMAPGNNHPHWFSIAYVQLIFQLLIMMKLCFLLWRVRQFRHLMELRGFNHVPLHQMEVEMERGASPILVQSSA